MADPGDGPVRIETGIEDVIKSEASKDSAAPDSSDPRDASGPSPDAADTSVATDAGRDANDAGRDANDAGRDGGADASDARDGGVCSPVDCPRVKFECVPEAAPTGGGLVIDTVFYVAYRFEVPAGRTLVSSRGRCSDPPGERHWEHLRSPDRDAQSHGVAESGPLAQLTYSGRA